MGYNKYFNVKYASYKSTIKNVGVGLIKPNEKSIRTEIMLHFSMVRRDYHHYFFIDCIRGPLPFY